LLEFEIGDIYLRKNLIDFDLEGLLKAILSQCVLFIKNIDNPEVVVYLWRVVPILEGSEEEVDAELVVLLFLIFVAELEVFVRKRIMIIVFAVGGVAFWSVLAGNF
jgi:hypothetical protein